MSLLSPKKDKYDQSILPGDVCATVINNKVELVVYKGRSWGGIQSKGEFGVFITPKGVSSLKYTSVIFAFDPMSPRRARSEAIRDGIKKYYEGKN